MRTKSWKRSWKLRFATLAGVLLICALVLEVASYLYLSSLDHHVLRIFEVSDAGAVSGNGVKRQFEQVWFAVEDMDQEFWVTIKTNNIGLREDRDYHGEKIDVGFLGDSFVFGHGVNAEERVSNRLQEHLPDKYVVSFSYLNGWTTPHYYCFLKKYPHLVPDIAVVCLFLGNDLTRDMEETALVFDDSGELRSVESLHREVSSRGFWVKKDANFTTRCLKKTCFGELLLRRGVMAKLGIHPAETQTSHCRSPEFDMGVLNDTNSLGLQFVLRMRELLDRQGKRLILFLIPPSFYIADRYPPQPYCSDSTVAADIRQNHYLLKTIMNWCYQNRVECINPATRFQEAELKGLRLYFLNDGHWNATGHGVAADIIAEYLAGS